MVPYLMVNWNSLQKLLTKIFGLHFSKCFRTIEFMGYKSQIFELWTCTDTDKVKFQQSTFQMFIFAWSHLNNSSTSRKYQFSNGQMQKCNFNFQLGESHKNLHHLAAGVDDSSSVYLALFQIKPKLQASSKVLSFRENSKILTCNITNWCQNRK